MNKACKSLMDFPCALQMSGPPDHYVGVKFSTIYYCGIHSFLCVYGGISLFETSASYFQEVVVFCNKSENFVKELFVKTQPLLIIVYQYMNLSSVNFSFKIHLSTCHPILLNPCFFSQFCNALIRPSCQQYLNNATHRSNIRLNSEKEFYFLGSGCVSFHFSTDFSHTFIKGSLYQSVTHLTHHKYECSATLHPSQSFKTAGVLHNQSYGFTANKSIASIYTAVYDILMDTIIRNIRN